MRFFLFLSLCLLFLFPQNGTAQFYGNSVVNNTSFFLNDGFTFWFKIETGATDSGFFTHLGINKAGFSGFCRIALYGDHPTSDQPQALLSMTEVNGYELEDGFNQFPLATNIVLTPSTTYWIAVKGSDDIFCGRDDTQNWAYSPQKYKTSFYSSSWPNPVSFSGASTINNPKKAAIWAIGNNQLLPVELSSFTVEIQQEKVILDWQTASETNNKGWNIQQSTNGHSWKIIDWVSGKGDGGSHYTYTDSSPTNGTSFYRLEQVDVDGTKAYSKIKSVELAYKKQAIYPNPVTDILRYKGFEQGAIFKFYNSLGELILTQEVHGNEPVDMSGLLMGVYFLRVEEGSSMFSFRILKE